MKDSPDIEKYLSWIDSEVEFDRIRNDLEQNGFTESEIKKIIQYIDNLHQQNALIKTNRMHKKHWVIVGSTISIISFIGFFIFPVPLMFFAFGSFGTGVGMIMMGRTYSVSNKNSKLNNKKIPFRKRTT